MRKFTFIIMVLAAVGSVFAADYRSVLFESLSGEKTLFAADNLSMKVESGNLLVDHAGGSYSTQLADLAWFSFSASASAVSAVFDSASAVDAFSISGVHLGRFESAEAAVSTLPAGIYLLKSERQILKINLAK